MLKKKKMFTPTNLYNELNKVKEITINQNNTVEFNTNQLKKLDPKNIYHINDIKKLALILDLDFWMQSYLKGFFLQKHQLNYNKLKKNTGFHM